MNASTLPKLLLIGCGSASVLMAQALRVYSEFRRVDPAGNLLAADSGGHPREILSPAIARNAYSSFRVVVTAPAGAEYELHIGQNPENAVKATLYHEVFVDRQPVSLEPVKEVPYRGRMPDGQSAQSFWLDVWVAGDAPVRRIKVEPQLYLNDAWWTYPMEVRVVDAKVPDKPSGSLRAYLCGADAAVTARALSPEQMIQRNMAQDAALARELERKQGKEAVAAALRARIPGDWCAAGFTAPDPEWYLKLRDFLYRAGQY